MCCVRKMESALVVRNLHMTIYIPMVLKQCFLSEDSEYISIFDEYLSCLQTAFLKFAVNKVRVLFLWSCYGTINADIGFVFTTHLISEWYEFVIIMNVFTANGVK